MVATKLAGRLEPTQDPCKVIEIEVKGQASSRHGLRFEVDFMPIPFQNVLICGQNRFAAYSESRLNHNGRSCHDTAIRLGQNEVFSLRRSSYDSASRSRKGPPAHRLSLQLPRFSIRHDPVVRIRFVPNFLCAERFDAARSHRRISPTVAEALRRHRHHRQRTDGVGLRQRSRQASLETDEPAGRFAIANEDFLYVLSTFVYEPIRWNQRFGWRPMCEQERLGYFFFWREVGRRMNIKRLPSDYNSFERFNQDYERKHYRFTEANQRVGAATRELFVSWFPRFLSPIVRSTIYALLDDPLIDAFGFPRPSLAMRRLAPAALRLRAAVAGLLPPRRHPRRRTEMSHPTYRDGYVIESLGPPGTH